MTARTRAGAHAKRDLADSKTSLPNRQRVERQLAKRAATKAARAAGAGEAAAPAVGADVAAIVAALSGPHQDPVDRTEAALDAAGLGRRLPEGLASEVHGVIEQWPGSLSAPGAYLACARAILRLVGEPR